MESRRRRAGRAVAALIFVAAVGLVAGCARSDTARTDDGDNRRGGFYGGVSGGTTRTP